MAIQFDKAFRTTGWVTSENNNVAEFYSDSSANPVSATVSFLNQSAKIYPNPQGKFYFNLKAFVFFENFFDDIDLSAIGGTNSNYLFDYTKAIEINDIQIDITLDDQTLESTTVPLHLILSAEQELDFRKGKTVTNKLEHILSPLIIRQGFTPINYFRVWEGYPFDFGFALFDDISPYTMTWQNQNHPLLYTFSVNHKSNRLGISSGLVANDLPLVKGYNFIDFENFQIEIQKVTDTCGVYVKWLNNQGGFSYWLFSKNHQDELTSSNIGIINNDFQNLGENTSPLKSFGVNVENQLFVIAENLTEDDMEILKSIITSKKIYLFTGNQFEASTDADWIEVAISNTTLVTRSFKGNQPDVSLTINLPDLNTILL